MNKLQNIRVGVDFSECSRCALKQADGACPARVAPMLLELLQVNSYA